MTVKDLNRSVDDSGLTHIWVKEFKNGPSKIVGRQSLKNLTLNFLKAVFHKFCLLDS